MPNQYPGTFTERLARRTTRWCGSTTAVLGSVLLTLLWFVTGPLFHWSDTWQLVANTFTTLVTFIMVFVLQRSSNKHGVVIQIKLDELLAANGRADRKVIGSEYLTEAEVGALEVHYKALGVRMRSKHTAVD